MLHSLVLLPFVAAAIAGLVSSADQRPALRWGVVASLAFTIWSFVVLGFGAETQSSAAYPWFPLWGSDGWVHWSLHADALATWLIHLTNLVVFSCLIAAGCWKVDRLREFIIAALVTQGAIIGCFLAADVVLFYLFFEAMLLPILVLVARQGDKDRQGAALQFFITTMLASVFMLVAIWYLAVTFGTTNIASLRDQVYTLGADSLAAELCFLAFALAFAVKTPLIPFHSWQARIYASAPAAGSALIAAVMAKVGVYGFLRLVLPLFPEQTAQWTGVLLTLAVAGTILGALMALVQTDLKRLLAYASLGHLSLIMVGVLIGGEMAYQGVVVQLVAHGLAVAALFLVIGALEHRRASRGLGDFGGLASSSPGYALLIIGSMLAAVAMPGTAAFAGEFLILLGVATSEGGSLLLAAVVGLSLVLTAAYLLRLVKEVVFGPVAVNLGAPKAGESVAIGLLLVASLVLGLFPRAITQPLTPLVQEWMSHPASYQQLVQDEAAATEDELLATDRSGAAWVHDGGSAEETAHGR
ncbi:MAG: NADH-quinone oxidoreductase subunit M [Planctomycetota bacterium]|nr:MAG: NADH-quinone oxidoreductase subunit M [Planctomycetota bacterium]